MGTTTTTTHSVKERRERANAGQLGGLKHAILHTPEERSAMNRSSNDVAWEHRVLQMHPEAAGDDARIAALIADKRPKYMRELNARRWQKYRATKAQEEEAAHTKADEAVTFASLALFTAAQLRKALRRIAWLEAQLKAS